MKKNLYLLLLIVGGILFNSTVAEAYRIWSDEETANFQDLSYKKSAAGPTLIFSDSPENVYETGILYRDEITGNGRIFFHHVNATGKQQKLAVLVRNKKLRPTDLYVTASGIGGPNKDYLKAGKESQEKYFQVQDKQDRKSVV